MFDFTRTPLAPPGIKVIAHNSIETRDSWGPHGKLAFYVGPAMNHYRCYKVYLPSARSIITTDTIECTEDNLFEIPYSSKEDDLLDAVQDLQSMLKDTRPLHTNSLSPRQTAIEKLQSILLKPPATNNNQANYELPPPRVHPSQNTIELMSVATPTADDPPDLTDEDHSDNYPHMEPIDFYESKK